MAINGIRQLSLSYCLQQIHFETSNIIIQVSWTILHSRSLTLIQSQRELKGKVNSRLDGIFLFILSPLANFPTVEYFRVWISFTWNIITNSIFPFFMFLLLLRLLFCFECALILSARQSFAYLFTRKTSLLQSFSILFGFFTLSDGMPAFNAAWVPPHSVANVCQTKLQLATESKNVYFTWGDRTDFVFVHNLSLFECWEQCVRSISKQFCFCGRFSILFRCWFSCFIVDRFFSFCRYTTNKRLWIIKMPRMCSL